MYFLNCVFCNEFKINDKLDYYKCSGCKTYIIGYLSNDKKYRTRLYLGDNIEKLDIKKLYDKTKK